MVVEDVVVVVIKLVIVKWWVEWGLGIIGIIVIIIE